MLQFIHWFIVVGTKVSLSLVVYFTYTLYLILYRLWLWWTGFIYCNFFIYFKLRI